MSDLSILLLSKLDLAASAKTINSQLPELEKQLKQLNLKVNINPQQFKILNDSLKQVQSQTEALNQSMSNIGSNVSKKVSFLNPGDLNNATKEVTTFNEGLGRTRTVIQQLNQESKKLEEVKTIISQNNDTIAKSQAKTFDQNNKEYLRGINLREKVEQALQARKLKLQDQENVEFLRGVKLRERAIQDSAKKEAKIFDQNNQEYLRGIKLREQYSEQQRKKEEKYLDTVAKLQNYRVNAQIDTQRLQGKYGSLVNQSELNAYLQSINALTARTPLLNREMERLSTSFRQIETNAKISSNALHIAQKDATSLGDALKNAFQKFPKINGEIVA
jgi:hypothetical protein